MSEPILPFTTKPVYVVVTKTGDKGTIDAHKIYEGYTVEGWMFEPPVVGKTFAILRLKRNGVEKVGLFETSMVEEIIFIGQSDSYHTYFVDTRNSYYKVNVKPEVEYDEMKIGVDFIAAMYAELDNPNNPISSKN